MMPEMTVPWVVESNAGCRRTVFRCCQHLGARWVVSFAGLSARDLDWDLRELCCCAPRLGALHDVGTCMPDLHAGLTGRLR